MVNFSEEWCIGKCVGVFYVFKDNDMVVYLAKGEEKGEVLVFIDISCGYCWKFYIEIL